MKIANMSASSIKTDLNSPKGCSLVDCKIYQLGCAFFRGALELFHAAYKRFDSARITSYQYLASYIQAIFSRIHTLFLQVFFASYSQDHLMLPLLLQEAKEKTSGKIKKLFLTESVLKVALASTCHAQDFWQLSGPNYLQDSLQLGSGFKETFKVREIPIFNQLKADFKRTPIIVSAFDKTSYRAGVLNTLELEDDLKGMIEFFFAKLNLSASCAQQVSVAINTIHQVLITNGFFLMMAQRPQDTMILQDSQSATDDDFHNFHILESGALDVNVSRAFKLVQFKTTLKKPVVIEMNFRILPCGVIENVKFCYKICC